jgi:transposase
VTGAQQGVTDSAAASHLAAGVRVREIVAVGDVFAESFGRSLQTVAQWLRRYESVGPAPGLAGRARWNSRTRVYPGLLGRPLVVGVCGGD